MDDMDLFVLILQKASFLKATERKVRINTTYCACNLANGIYFLKKQNISFASRNQNVGN